MLTREDIREEYKVENGIIRSPGKFEGEPEYAVYLWECYLNGAYDSEEDDLIIFYPDGEDVTRFPELGDFSIVTLRQDDNGFIYAN